LQHAGSSGWGWSIASEIRRRHPTPPPDQTTGSDASDAAADSGGDAAQKTCDAGQTSCSGQCIDLTTSTQNCGACGHACTGSFTCSASECGDQVDQVARGQGHVCVLLHDGSVWCRGQSQLMQLGTTAANDPFCQYTGNVVGSSPTCHSAFVKVNLSGAASQVAAGGYSTCAVMKSNGSVFCWGSNSAGQLGHQTGTGSDKTCPGTSTVACCDIPSQVTITADPVTQLSMGIGTNCAVTSKSDVYCWGLGDEGELGDTLGVSNFNPVKALSNASEVSVGYPFQSAFPSQNGAHVCAVTKANTVFCWGNNMYGQLGHPANMGGDSFCCGNDYFNKTPSQAGGLSVITPKHVASGPGFTCVLDVNGAVSCWGDNTMATIQLPPSGTVATPTAVSGVPALASLNAFSTHVCGATATGDAWCWGDE
jgi:alpha-tubulin suppressor-like RCC1 family protein